MPLAPREPDHDALRLTRIDGLTNIFSVTQRCGLLCVQCRDCGHRGVVRAEQLTVGLNGNMTPVSASRIRCTTCGSASTDRLLPLTREDADAFLAGARLRDD